MVIINSGFIIDGKGDSNLYQKFISLYRRNIRLRASKGIYKDAIEVRRKVVSHTKSKRRFMTYYKPNNKVKEIQLPY